MNHKIITCLFCNGRRNFNFPLIHIYFQLNTQTPTGQPEMSLKRALYVMYEHHIRFQWLAYIAELSSDKKGGALITAIHGFLQHGSKCAQEVNH